MRAEADSVFFGQDIECKLLMKYLFSHGSLHETCSVFFYNQSEFNLKSNCKLTFCINMYIGKKNRIAHMPA